MKAFTYIAAVITVSGVLSGCSTVKVPDVDFLKLPEFREIVKNNQTNVPKISEIPDPPKDVRSSTVWDTDAARLIKMRDGFIVPDSEGTKPSQQQIDDEFARRKAQAQAYKLDDPQ